MTIVSSDFMVYSEEYDNSQVGEEERFAFRHVGAALFDWQVRIVTETQREY